MSQRALIVTAIMIAGGLVASLFWQSRPPLPSRPMTSSATATVTAHVNASSTPVAFSTGQIPKQSLGHEQIAAEVTRRDRTDSRWEWKIPIKFYGLVVDEHEHPIPGADVHFEWTSLSIKGTDNLDIKTNEKGQFLLENVQGKRLGVRIVKAGYYSSDSRNQWSFEYANPFEENFYQPQPEAPVVFHLRRQKPSPDVVSKSTKVMLQGDAATVRVSLDTGKPSANGELMISSSKPWPSRPMSPSYDWQVGFRMENGGFLETPEQFAFEAPESGYLPDYTVDMRAALGSAWKVNVERTVYFVFGDPRKYGRLSFRTDGNSRYVFLDYVINYAGGRNLEAQPASE
jgi:hypothetical protein